MDDNENKNIFDAATGVHLTEKERAVIRRAISAYVLEHPKQSEDEREPEHRAWFVSWNMLSRPLPAALLSMFLISAGGSVSFAAERSLPGDTLYPVKISFNENIQLALAFSDEAKAELEAERVERRLQEAEVLMQRSSFTQQARVDAEERFDVQAKRARSRISNLEENGKLQAAAELSSNFEAALRVHGRILGNLAAIASSTDASEHNEIENLRRTVSTEEDDTVLKRSEVEHKLSTNVDASRTAAEERMHSTLKKIAEGEAFIHVNEQAFGATTFAAAEARLATALSTVADGKAKLDQGDAPGAFRLFQKANRIAEEAKLLMNARQNLKIDIQLDSISDDGTGQSDDKSDVMVQ